MSLLTDLLVCRARSGMRHLLLQISIEALLQIRYLRFVFVCHTFASIIEVIIHSVNKTLLRDILSGGSW